MKKLRGSRGVTLTETLCTVLIVLLISAMLAVGVRFAVRTYRESMELSETELLCSTLTAAISDKLRYSGEVGQNMFIQGVGTTDSGGGGSFAISDDGDSDDRQRGVPAPRLGLLPAGPAGADDRHGGNGLHQLQRRNRNLYRFLCHRGRAGEYPEGDMLRRQAHQCGQKVKKSCRTFCPAAPFNRFV